MSKSDNNLQSNNLQSNSDFNIKHYKLKQCFYGCKLDKNHNSHPLWICKLFTSHQDADAYVLSTEETNISTRLVPVTCMLTYFYQAYTLHKELNFPIFIEKA